MNVNGKNASKCGPFDEHIRALDVMFASGDFCTLTPERDAPLFHTFICSMGVAGHHHVDYRPTQHINAGRVPIPAQTLAPG